MTKKRATKNIVLVVLLFIIGILLAFCRFDIPFTNYTYNGFINSIKMGLDVSGGVTAVYDAKLADENSGVDLDTAIKSTINRLESILADRGYTEATVTTQQGNRIRVEVPDVEDPQEVFDLIGNPAKLSFKTEEDPNAESKITGSDIKNVEYGFQNNEHGVVVDFTSEGAIKFSDLTQELSSSGGSVYVYIGDELFTTLTVQEHITSGSTFISGGGSDPNGKMTRAEAEEFALRIMSGTFSAELSLYESSIVSATLGMNAISSGLIAAIVGLILIFIFMAFVYRTFGLMADIALMFYVILVLFFLQAIPLVQLTLPGIAGIILSLGMAVDANIIIFERIKDEYKHGKRIPASVKGGFKRATSAILDSNITTLMVCVVLYLLGTGAIKGFAITLFIGIVVSMFTAIFVTRWLINICLAFNSSKEQHYNLYREEGVNEVA